MSATKSRTSTWAGLLPLLFVASWAGVYLVSRVALSWPVDSRVVEVAVTADLTVVVPALYALLLVKGRGWPALGLLPVFLLSLLLASVVLPEGRRSALRAVELLAVPAELVLVGVLVRRGVRAARRSRASEEPDVLERIRVAVREALPYRRASEILAFEAALLWYALLSWRTPPPDSGEGRRWSYHRTSSYGAVVAAVLMVMAAEVVGVHLLLARWSATAAWILTALGVYGGLWLIGDVRALRLRPVMLGHERLIVRSGLRWTVEIPLARIAATALSGPGRHGDRPDVRMVLPGARSVRIDLDSPVTALGAYGTRRRVRSLEFGLDDPVGFVDALSEARSSSPTGTRPTP